MNDSTPNSMPDLKQGSQAVPFAFREARRRIRTLLLTLSEAERQSDIERLITDSSRALQEAWEITAVLGRVSVALQRSRDEYQNDSASAALPDSRSNRL